MNQLQTICPYPGTCRYFRAEEGRPRCLRESCPFRIHLRRLIGGEIRRLSQVPSPTQEQRQELECMKREYARLLAPQGRWGPWEETAVPAACGPWRPLWGVIWKSAAPGRNSPP